MLLTIEAFWHKWRKTYEQVDCFICPSQFIADLTKQRIPINKLTVLPNGIDITVFTPPYNSNGYALYFGRLSKEKGVHTLLAAHQRVASSLSLKVVGTGPLEKELREAYPRASFLGYCNGRALNDLIAQAMFVVVPSEWYENCSMVVLEAMAHGKPVVGSRIGGIPEQIEDGRSGLLFSMGSIDDLVKKMKYLMSNPQVIIEMGKNARKKFENEYDLSKHCQNLLSVYNQLLSKRS